MFKRLIITTTIFLNLLVPTFASAAPVDNSSQLPEMNPFCWRRADCNKIRKQFGTENDKSGFVSDQSVAPCLGGDVKGGPNEWGRCLPAGTSKTEISFGGKSEFANVGEFLVLMYKYLLTIASIVAVVVIIIAGAQWITSGGNSEAISSAKKRIGGAVIGLFIAYMSYFILNTINPALVNLRLPQVWLVKPQSLTPEFCRDLDRPGQEGKTNFMYAASSGEQTKPVTLETVAEEDKKDGFKWTDVSTKPFVCGARFFVEGGGKTGTCRGDVCPMEGENQLSCFDQVGDRKMYECSNVRIAGNVSYSAIAKKCGGFFELAAKEIAEEVAEIFDVWGCPPLTSEWLTVVCKAEGGTRAFGPNGHGESESHYWIEYESSKVTSESEAICAEHGGVKGFVVRAAMKIENLVMPDDDSWHYIGKGGVDLGSNWFFKNYAHKIDKRFLFTPEEITRGARLDFDASDVAPVTFDLGSANFGAVAAEGRYEKYFEK